MASRPRPPNALPIFGVLFLCWMAVPPSGPTFVRNDVLDSSWHSGFLTWKDGKGGINWASTNGTEDLVTPASEPSGLAPAEFRSDPLPWTRYLNASRNIHVDVNLVAGENPPPPSRDSSGKLCSRQECVAAREPGPGFSIP